MRSFYVVQIGDIIKVGHTLCPPERLAVHRRQAQRNGQSFAVLYASPWHTSSWDTEGAVLARFRPQGQRTEYLSNVDPAEVVAFAEHLIAQLPPEDFYCGCGCGRYQSSCPRWPGNKYARPARVLQGARHTQAVPA